MISLTHILFWVPGLHIHLLTGHLHVVVLLHFHFNTITHSPLHTLSFSCFSCSVNWPPSHCPSWACWLSGSRSWTLLSLQLPCQVYPRQVQLILPPKFLLESIILSQLLNTTILSPGVHIRSSQLSTELLPGLFISTPHYCQSDPSKAQSSSCFVSAECPWNISSNPSTWPTMSFIVQAMPTSLVLSLTSPFVYSPLVLLKVRSTGWQHQQSLLEI